MQIAGKIIFMLLLSVCAWVDWKRKEIPLWVICLGSVTGLVLWCMQSENVWGQIWSGGFLPGICLMCMAILTDGKIGLGDGILVSMGGFYLSLAQVLQWVFVGSLCCGVWGSVLLVFRLLCKREQKVDKELAYAPFLWISALFLWIQPM